YSSTSWSDERRGAKGRWFTNAQPCYGGNSELRRCRAFRGIPAKIADVRRRYVLPLDSRRLRSWSS
ncbi:hypothetical protein TELCIR_22909, partial [Teladorsagia circumcincta]